MYLPSLRSFADEGFVVSDKSKDLIQPSGLSIQAHKECHTTVWEECFCLLCIYIDHIVAGLLREARTNALAT